MDKLEVKIFETYSKERCWFQDLLEDQAIPFRLEHEIIWGGSSKEPKCLEKQCFFVPCIYESRLLEQIAEYGDLDNLTQEARDEIDNQPDEIPQIVCSSCGKGYDFDYPRCPYCKHKE